MKKNPEKLPLIIKSSYNLVMAPSQRHRNINNGHTFLRQTYPTCKTYVQIFMKIKSREIIK